MRSTGGAIGAVVGSFLAVLTVVLLCTWGAMLCLGAAHSYDGRIPALGFTTTLWLGIAIRLLVMAGSAAKND